MGRRLNLLGVYSLASVICVILSAPGQLNASSFTDTTQSNFLAGTGGCSVVTHTSVPPLAQVILGPTLSEDFSVYPPTWDSPAVKYDPFGTGFGDVDHSPGELTVEGAITGPGSTFAAGRTLEFVASFTGPNQAVGFGTTTVDDPAPNAGAPYAFFFTDSFGLLFARSNDGSGDQPTQVTVLNLDTPHLYRIEWFGGVSPRVDFYISDPNPPDAVGDVLVTSHTFTTTQTMRPIASDHDLEGSFLAVDFMRMSPYLSQCTFTSRVFDAGTQVLFATITADKKLPPGTTLTLCVKTGNTAGDLASATCTAESAINRVGRFVQYVATLSSPAQLRTPELRSVTISYQDQCAGVVCSGTPNGCQLASTCNPATGTCSFPPQPNGTTCNDGNACTFNDTCQSGTCQGTPITCTSDQCKTRTCNGTSTCTVTPKTGTLCNDSIACTFNDTCTSSGTCVGTTITCTSDQCNTRACNGTSSCAVTPLTGLACNDGNGCTTTDTCQSGVCTGNDICKRIKVTGGGNAGTGGSCANKAQFAANVVRKPNNSKIKGHFTFSDKASGIKIDGVVDTLNSSNGTNAATFSGSCGSTCRFTVYVVDNGKNDTIRVVITGNGNKNLDTGVQPLCNGNIEFHPGGKHFDHDDDHDGHEFDDD